MCKILYVFFFFFFFFHFIEQGCSLVIQKIFVFIRLSQCFQFELGITFSIQSNIIISCLLMKTSIFQLYESIFEGALLRETGSFYRKEASALLQDCNVSQYMECVIARLAEEELRATKFLPPR